MDRETVLGAVRQNALALESAAAELKGDREIVVEAVEQLEAVKQNALAAPAVWLLIIIATCWLLIIIATCSLLGAARAMFSAAPSTAIWRLCGGYATLGPPPRLQGRLYACSLLAHIFDVSGLHVECFT